MKKVEIERILGLPRNIFFSREEFIEGFETLFCVKI